MNSWASFSSLLDLKVLCNSVPCFLIVKLRKNQEIWENIFLHEVLNFFLLTLFKEKYDFKSQIMTGIRNEEKGSTSVKYLQTWVGFITTTNEGLKDKCRAASLWGLIFSSSVTPRLFD